MSIEGARLRSLFDCLSRLSTWLRLKPVTFNGIGANGAKGTNQSKSADSANGVYPRGEPEGGCSGYRPCPGSAVAGAQRHRESIEFLSVS